MPRSRRRGEPLLVLAAVLLSWVGLRAAQWQQPYAPEVAGLATQLAHRFGHRLMPRNSELAQPASLVSVAPLRPWRPEPLALRPQDGALPSPVPGERTDATSRSGVAAANQLLWMSAMAGLPSPQALLSHGSGPVVPDLGRVRPAAERRWTGDGWLMWRQGGASASHGLAPPTYGASQGGAVLRYALAPSSALQPTLYMRVTGAMDGSGEADSAFGFSARPISGLPLIAAVEGRVSRFANGTTHLRPAAMVVTELTPQPMPFAMRAEIYAAAGYVGGPGATAFVDGQLRVDHHVATVGPTEVRAGGGVWGGAQQGANRLDVGPTATVRLAGQHYAARLGLDWRLRVAGDAAPSSGPAVTVAAGF